MMEYLGCSDDKEFNRVYRGLERVKYGKTPKDNGCGFNENTSPDPISDEANSVQYYASQAFHGGYNICTEVGWFPYATFDFDLQNAYATSMCLILDPDWENIIKTEITQRDLSLADYTDNGVVNPLKPFVGYVTFEFPANVMYPCIPINVDGVPAYPRTSDGLNGVYVAGPYIYLALKLGAKIHCQRGFFLSIRKNEDGSDSKSLSTVVKQLVSDRNKAKKDHGKGCLEELALKEIVCSGYGKIAQNVIDKSSWNAFKDEMEQLGCSAITNPVAAMMITAIVQVVLLAAQNQILEKQHMTCSVTTDGFISDCPEDLLTSLDLYGLRKSMEEARLFLTDGNDPEIWEIKHVQDDLLNFTTRGNISLHWIEKDDDGNIIAGDPMIYNGKKYEGVSAHNSAVSGEPKDSYADRLWLMKQILSRRDKVISTKKVFTSFKELVSGVPLSHQPETRNLRMDFDMKRKPIRDSVTTDKVTIEGVEYEIAHFDTEPFDTVEEFRLYRAKKELCTVLRTETDWKVFWEKLELKESNAKPRDMDWAILNSCIIGHRAGFWYISGLDGKTVEQKCDWINQHNISTKKFKPSDWKNARRAERQVNMLPEDIIQDKLTELLNAV